MNAMKFKILKYIKKYLVKTLRFLYKLTYKRIKVDDKLVIFLAYHGRGYSCNPKALHQYMINNNKYIDFNYVWAVKDKNKVEIPNAKVIRYNGFCYFYYMAKAKYWFINCKLPKHILKKDNQIYLQTWHGTPLKRLAHDIEGNQDMTFYRSEITREQMLETYDIDVAKYNYMISPNAYSTDKFMSAFQINKERMLESGYPRNDFLVNLSAEEINKIKAKYNINTSKKVILYAPTWRDQSYSIKGYTFELKANFKLWKEQLADEYIVIFKPHYLIVNKYENDVELQDFIINANPDMDINELYAISDILITDYSSVFFDYANLDRPIYFYMFDLKEYSEELRGFYFNIYDVLPGNIIENEIELISEIKNSVYDYERLKEFNAQFNALQDGNSSKRVLDTVIKVNI